jgi:25S rRNA (adenine2142-N1)-methyltransferase
MARKRKLFTGVAPIGGHKVKSLREARRITSKFHQLNNEIGLIDSNSSVPEEKLKKQRIEEEIEMLGGRNRYQQASVVTTTHHKVSYSFMNRCKLIIYIFFRPANG